LFLLSYTAVRADAEKTAAGKTVEKRGRQAGRRWIERRRSSWSRAGEETKKGSRCDERCGDLLENPD